MNPAQLPQHIFGLHDPGGEQLFGDAGKHGWTVISVQVSPPDSDGNFSALADAGHGVIVRLNNGYGSEGTIPVSSEYDKFAQECAAFVAGSRGAGIWIIGNETNLRVERPGNSDADEGQAITPALYAQCYSKVRAAIRALPGHEQDWVIPSPPGPWNVQTPYPGNPDGDWVIYFRDLLNQCIALGASPDALAIHTYTHEGPFEAGVVTSGDRFQQPPFQQRHFQFRAFQDFLSVVPDTLRGLPVLITESQALPWEDRDVGWIQAAYNEINGWNAVATNQPIQALCLFRWKHNEDDPPGWSISNRPRLLQDFRAALQNDFRTRWLTASTPAKPAPPVQPVGPKEPKPVPQPELLPLDKARWHVEEAIRKLEASDAGGARELLQQVVIPWFYASAAQHSNDLPNAQAHTTARWFCEEAVRRIEADKPGEARELLRDHVLPWLTSTGPSALGILKAAAPTPKSRAKKPAAKKTTAKKKKPAAKKTTTAKKTMPAKRSTRRLGVLGPVETTAAAVPAATAASASLRDTLLALADAKQLIPFNLQAALQRRMFADGLVPNSGEFELTEARVKYVAQRAEDLLTGEVRVYFAPTTDFNDVRFVVRGGSSAFSTPFEGGNRITQRFGERPDFYRPFGLTGHEGVDMVPKDGDRDILCIEDGIVLKQVDVPGDPKVNAYGIYVVVFNRHNHRLWYYCHLIETQVTRNQPLNRGERVGRMGGTGNTQGDHLHLGLKPVTNVGVTLEPNNGFKGFTDPLPVLDALNDAEVDTGLRDALLSKAEAVQVISFNTQAALQKRMFADGLCPNSAEFEVEDGGAKYVAQRAEKLESGQVRVYYAPVTDFNAVEFIDRS